MSVSSPCMDPVRYLVSLRQGNCTLEAHIQRFLDIAHLSDLPDCALIDFFAYGLNEPLKGYLNVNGPRGTFREFLDFALLTVGSRFTVGVVGKHDTAVNHVMATAPVDPNKMAATITTSHHVSADRPEQHHASADRPEQRHASADRPEQRHASADRPEQRHVSADRPESRHVPRSVRERRGLRSSVADPPLISARAAGIPTHPPAASLSSPPDASHMSSSLSTHSSSSVSTHPSALDAMDKMAALPVPTGKMAAPAVLRDVGGASASESAPEPASAGEPSPHPRKRRRRRRAPSSPQDANVLQEAAVELETTPKHQLKKTQRSFQQKIQQREKDLQQMREAVESHKRSAQTAVKDSERIFTELIRSIQRSRSEATQRIRDQEKNAVSRAEGRLERLEQEINDLRRRDAELEQLSHTQDHIHFLQSFQSLSAPPESTDVNDDPFSSLSSFDVVRESVRQLRDKLEDFCKEELKKISDRVTFTNIVPRTRNDFLLYVNDDPFSSLSSFDVVRESVRQLRDKLEDFCKEELKKISDRVTFTNIVPRTRNDFLLYSHHFTLDPNTVYKRLCLSEENRVIADTDTVQSYPDHPDRFDGYLQVLCRESVCGRCYWEIGWSGYNVRISVSYKSISRKGSGNECVFGSNDQSWSLICSSSSYSFTHNNIQTKLPVKSISSRIGVYVDHSAGTLSFYSVSGETMSLVHTVQTTFTQPLYPGFYVYGSSVKLC
ncbi:Tripartite motif-containing protein 16 [Anabarilius grahami]|uniref:Tripartite motif-containing protein 16 n=1 Tax=Anabarilius grahami TaxID=495550 RepID=A0A3N0Y1E3_ANAGA|nr:Tripartite motif-containing protein 16 [Anabarilius grahami]